MTATTQLIMDRNFKIATYNIHGAKNCNWHYLDHIVRSHEFTLIQEHWLHSSEFHLLSDKLRNANCACTSGMHDTEIVQGRPYGGCAIVWNASLDWAVEPIACVSERLCAVKVTSSVDNFVLLLFSLYMPIDTEFDDDNNETFLSILREVTDLSDSFRLRCLWRGF